MGRQSWGGGGGLEGQREGRTRTRAWPLPACSALGQAAAVRPLGAEPWLSRTRWPPRAASSLPSASVPLGSSGRSAHVHVGSCWARPRGTRAAPCHIVTLHLHLLGPLHAWVGLQGWALFEPLRVWQGRPGPGAWATPSSLTARAFRQALPLCTPAPGLGTWWPLGHSA